MDPIALKESISSKKFLFAIASVWAIFIFAYISAGSMPMMAPMYDAFVGGVVALAGLYLAGNITNKLVVGRNSKITPPSSTKEEQS